MLAQDDRIPLRPSRQLWGPKAQRVGFRLCPGLQLGSGCKGLSSGSPRLTGRCEVKTPSVFAGPSSQRLPLNKLFNFQHPGVLPDQSFLPHRRPRAQSCWTMGEMRAAPRSHTPLPSPAPPDYDTVPRVPRKPDGSFHVPERLTSLPGKNCEPGTLWQGENKSV